jgi:hypothetical protein
MQLHSIAQPTGILLTVMHRKRSRINPTHLGRQAIGLNHTLTQFFI